ncbi:MAG: hypothetical protein ABIF10_00580 [Candidatus Woesearchaeota archaeon]
MKTALLLGLLLIPLTTALEMPGLAELKETYNSNIEEIPGFVKLIIGSERINGYLLMDDGTMLNVTATTEKGVMQTLEYAENENPTLEVRATQQTADSVITSENPRQALKDAIDSKEIQIKAIGFKKVKWGIGKLAYRIASWFT